MTGSQLVNSALYHHQAPFSTLILSGPLRMLSDSNRFLNQMVEILREIRARPLGTRILKILIPVQKTELCRTMWVPQDLTCLGGSQAFYSQFANLFLHVVRHQFQSRGGARAVGQQWLKQALPGSLHMNHDGGGPQFYIWRKRCCWSVLQFYHWVPLVSAFLLGYYYYVIVLTLAAERVLGKIIPKLYRLFLSKLLSANFRYFSQSYPKGAFLGFFFFKWIGK